MGLILCIKCISLIVCIVHKYINMQRNTKLCNVPVFFNKNSCQECKIRLRVHMYVFMEQIKLLDAHLYYKYVCLDRIFLRTSIFFYQFLPNKESNSELQIRYSYINISCNPYTFPTGVKCIYKCKSIFQQY